MESPWSRLAELPLVVESCDYDLAETARRPADHVERVSYDAPIHGAEDIGATRFRRAW